MSDISEDYSFTASNLRSQKNKTSDIFLFSVIFSKYK